MFDITSTESPSDASFSSQDDCIYSGTIPHSFNYNFNTICESVSVDSCKDNEKIQLPPNIQNKADRCDSLREAERNFRREIGKNPGAGGIIREQTKLRFFVSGPSNTDQRIYPVNPNNQNY